ncbi:TPMT family class I SAM-dependent methyltransferase [Saprospiraceae bacterium]|jgi:thiopurine S-methyltransferase|nr:TPMT family class I SAM-dependent methyltransferase [bacterium]MDA9333334.1 TPMT family class I SAM-dependent methyltransferase [Saprospiraceae bacterium]HCV49774.1 SAM-dependent methyltransferase [Saprospirales bacterium]MDA9357789.1 TPMT family class I SAM-dependent methyltransferase [Saprospiraceae bacterium]MDB4162719.1 TPMT family class I SAM-dependent methyltransferase [Saprospiraceae bacterium]
MNFDEQYWTERYDAGKDGWDLGCISPPIKEYIDQLTNKDIKILIPGAGNSHEAEYIHNQGFTNLYVCDISNVPLDNLKDRVTTFPIDNLIHGNFFEIQDEFDLVLEQTFFCALNPLLRQDYIEQMSKIIKPKGSLIGLLFSMEFDREGPPFGGVINNYKAMFSKKFDIRVITPCTNSIESRMGSELFINMRPR